MSEEKKKSAKIKIYDKVIETNHAYDDNTNAQVLAALESQWQQLAYVDTKHRPNDKLTEVHTSHEFHTLDIAGKLGIQFIFRNRNSSIRFHKDKIIDAVNAVLGQPTEMKADSIVKPKTEKKTKKTKSSREVVTEPVELLWDDNDVPELSDDDVSDDVPELDLPNLDLPDLEEDEPNDETNERTYYDYKYWKESSSQSSGAKTKNKAETKSWVDSNTVTGFFVGALVMKFLVTGKLN
jgi:hypothetical protein